MSKEIQIGFVTLNEIPKVSTEIPKVTRDNRGRFVWNLSGNTPEQNEQLGISNVQGLFLEKFPVFNELFPREEDGTISKDKIEEAEKFITERIGKSRQFRVIISGTVLNKGQVPYFEGSFAIAIRKAFSPWGLYLDGLKNVNSQENRWMTLGDARKKIGVSRETAVALLESIPSKEGRTKNGRRTTLYDKNAVERLAEDYVSASITDRVTGLARDNSNTMFVSLQALSSESKLSIPTLIKLLQEVKTIHGRNHRNQPLTLYELIEAREKISNFLALPEINQETNVYIDENNTRWISVSTFIKNSGRSGFFGVLRNRLNDIPTRRGRGKNNIPLTLVDETQANKVLERLNQGKGFWTPDRIEQDALEFYRVNGRLSSWSLRKFGRYDLSNAINNRYPGKMRGLKEKLGLGHLNHKDTISPDEANEELMRFLDIKV